MRLLDRIATEGMNCLKQNLDVVGTVNRLQSAQLVVIDNVADYHFQDVRRTDSMKVSDFPNVMLPFESAFLEMRVNLKLEGVYEQCGVLMDMLEFESFIGRNRVVVEKSPQMQELAARGDVAYILRCLLFGYSRTWSKPELIGSFGFPVDVEGRILPLGNGSFPALGQIFGRNSEETSQDTHELLIGMLQMYLYPCLLALSFMHCRNVKVRQVTPPPKLSKKREKKTGLPLLKYRILLIDHMKQILEQEGHASSEGLQKALHICRGHFKNYGRDGKGLLFGKHAATVWIPMHIRGNAEEGIVVKDYDVK